MRGNDYYSQIFQQGCEDGPGSLPVAVSKMLTRIREEAVVPSSAELESLGWAVADECLAESETASPESAHHEEAVRGLLRAVNNWKSRESSSLSELNVLLTALNALDMNSTGLNSVALALENSDLVNGLTEFLGGLDVGPMLSLVPHLMNVRAELKAEALKGSYKRLHQLIPHLMPEPPPGGWAAIILLWKLDPDNLALVVSEKDDVFFSLFVCLVLKRNSIELALRVNLPVFKFIVASKLEEERWPDGDSAEVRLLLERLLIQVSQTNHWSAWMKELFLSPDERSLMNQVLPLVLAKIEEVHWQAVVDAVQLAGLKRTASAVATMMMTFCNEVGPIKATKMWDMCFDRWDKWDYGRGEQYNHLFAPVICAFDYPICRYYSQIDANALDVEETALAAAVEGIERQWFTSLTDLVTERNRLLSRLRLVKHGREISTGTSEPLPPLPTPSDTYSQVRYRYFSSQ